MKTHRFDPVSLLLGLATIVIGIAAINGHLGNLANDRPDSLIPMIALGAGLLAVIVATRRSFQDVDGAGDDQHDSGE